MAEPLAWTLYLIGLLAVATSARDDPRLAVTPLWVGIALGFAWPLAAVLVLVGRAWKAVRGG